MVKQYFYVCNKHRQSEGYVLLQIMLSVHECNDENEDSNTQVNTTKHVLVNWYTFFTKEVVVFVINLVFSCF